MHIKDVLGAIFSDLRKPENQKNALLADAWPEIAGPAVAAHTRVQLGERGDLRVWVDESTLAFELNQKHRGKILSGLQKVLGRQAVQNIRFFVGQIR